MPRASNEILIDRPCDDVFAFLADPENALSHQKS